jgi:hypothetical protein
MIEDTVTDAELIERDPKGEDFFISKRIETSEDFVKELHDLSQTLSCRITIFLPLMGQRHYPF